MTNIPMTAAARHGARQDPAMAPALTVAAIIERQGRFLMVEEWAHGERVFNQPAGHVEPGESPVDAVVREVLEETAWAFQPESVTGIYLWQRPGTALRFLRVVFCGRVKEHVAGRALDQGIIATHWLPRSVLASRSAELRSPMVLRGIDDYLGGRRLPPGSVCGLDLRDLLEQARPV